MAKSSCCVCKMHLCLVVCDHRARLYEAYSTDSSACDGGKISQEHAHIAVRTPSESYKYTAVGEQY